MCGSCRRHRPLQSSRGRCSLTVMAARPHRCQPLRRRRRQATLSSAVNNTSLPLTMRNTEAVMESRPTDMRAVAARSNTVGMAMSSSVRPSRRLPALSAGRRLPPGGVAVPPLASLPGQERSSRGCCSGEPSCAAARPCRRRHERRRRAAEAPGAQHAMAMNISSVEAHGFSKACTWPPAPGAYDDNSR